MKKWINNSSLSPVWWWALAMIRGTTWRVLIIFQDQSCSILKVAPCSLQLMIGTYNCAIEIKNFISWFAVPLLSGLFSWCHLGINALIKGTKAILTIPVCQGSADKFEMYLQSLITYFNGLFSIQMICNKLSRTSVLLIYPRHKYYNVKVQDMRHRCELWLYNKMNK